MGLRENDRNLIQTKREGLRSKRKCVNVSQHQCRIAGTYLHRRTNRKEGGRFKTKKIGEREQKNILIAEKETKSRAKRRSKWGCNEEEEKHRSTQETECRASFRNEKLRGRPSKETIYNAFMQCTHVIATNNGGKGAARHTHICTYIHALLCRHPLPKHTPLLSSAQCSLPLDAFQRFHPAPPPDTSQHLSPPPRKWRKMCN
uniref:Uncharacterized protein n=1 Tax=Trypanosoma congolense (strain IL3000) TaxID=1068625 RepID=G0UN25_TRYCI|nr:hypothetical protein TCIL3000_6_110 [Trypanosoma congolense IL3000]